MNYGDLLFPVLFREVFRDELAEIRFRNYGVVRSNFSAYGAIPTLSYKDLIRTIAVDEDVVVIGGGGVLFPTWRKLLSLINPVYALLFKRKLTRKVERRLNLAKRLLTTDDSLSPFAPTFEARVIYNAVGGRFPDTLSTVQRQGLTARLNTAEYVSVRDSITKSNLIRNKVANINLTPDSAVVMSDFYRIDGNLRKYTGARIGMFKKYIVFQVGRYKGPSDIAILEPSFAELRKLGYQILCVPIGTAPGHEDDVILKRIAKTSDHCEYYEPASIFETMFLIGNSDLYIGTSLHGTITAFSFGKPFIPLNRKVKKLDGYCKTWWKQIANGCVEFEQLKHAIENVLSGWDYEEADRLLRRQKALVHRNFDRIRQTLEAPA